MLYIWPRFPYSVKKLTAVTFLQVYFDLVVDVEKLSFTSFLIMPSEILKTWIIYLKHIYELNTVSVSDSWFRR